MSQPLPNCPACGQPLSLSDMTTTTGKTDRLVSCRNRGCANTSAQSGLFVRPEEEPADAATVLVRIISSRLKRGAQ